MFSETPILIADDNPYLSLDLSIAIEEMGGRVVGPASTVAEALSLLITNEVAAAIVECHLAERDATPLARQLAERSLPFVFHTSTAVPNEFAELHPLVPVLRKPLQPAAVLTRLLDEIHKAEQRCGAATPCD